MRRRRTGQRRYGARVYPAEPGWALIRQMVKSDGRYRLDPDAPAPAPVRLRDAGAVAEALRRALAGRL